MLDAAALNEAMVDRMKASGAIRSSAVEAAFRKTLRHVFLPGVGLDFVYSGQAVVTRADPKLGVTSSSSEVFVMGPQLEALDVRPGMRVLEIGAGTGYNAALLDELVGANGGVITIDNQPDVANDAREHLAAAGHERVRVMAGDGYEGYTDGAPYDRIILTAGARDVPTPLRDQLGRDGLLEVPMRFTNATQFVVVFRRDGDALESVKVVPGWFMPLRSERQPLEESVAVGDTWEMWLTSARDGDARVISELLRTEPAIELTRPVSPYVQTGLAGLVERDWITLRQKQRGGMWYGVFDREARALALLTPISSPDGTPRTALLQYGGTAAAKRIDAAVEALAVTAIDRLRVRAVPRERPRPDGDAVFERANFNYAIDWRTR